MKTTLCAVAVFILLGIVAPVLVDMHKDLALAGALCALVAAVAIAAWGASEIIADSRTIAEARRQRALPPLKEENP